MSTPKYGKGWFEYEGDDLMMYVKWDLHDDEMFVNVYLTSDFKVEVTDFLFDSTLDKIYDLAQDEYWGGNQ